MTDHSQHQDPDSMDRTAARLAYTDHDLLIRIDKHLELLSKDFDGFKVQVNEQLQKLWQEKASVASFAGYQEQHQRAHDEIDDKVSDTEKRVRKTELRLVWFGGLLTGLNVAIHILLKA